MGDSGRDIENLIYAYAERLDAGDLDGVAELFAHGRICGIENGPPETVFTGDAGVRQMYEMATRLYDDGTPKTKHNTSNVQIDVDDAAGTAQQPLLLLRHAGDAGPAAAGHRHRPLPRHLPPRRRRVVVRHPDHVRRSGGRHEPPPEVLTAVRTPFDAARLDGRRAGEGRASRTGGRCRSRRRWRCSADSYAAAGAQRHRRVHPARGTRAQPADATARRRSGSADIPRSPRRQIVAPIVVVGMMRSGTTLLQRLLAADPRFHCAYGWEVVEVAPEAGLPVVDARGSPHRDQRGARGDSRVSWPRNCSRSTPCTPASPRRRSSSCPMRSSPTCRSRAPTCPRTGRGSTSRTSPRRTTTCTGCCSSCSGRSGRSGKLGPRSAGCSRHRRTWATSMRCATQFPDLHVVHMHRDPRDTIPSGASLNATLHAMHADHVDRSGSAPSG